MRSNKSLVIQSFIGWAFANFVMHMSGVAHQPIHSVWDIVLIWWITWGAMAMVFSISKLYKLHKEAKESQAKYHEAMEKFEAMIKENKV